MKLVVLGASGGIGRHLVTLAAARGHTVTAVGRASSTLSVPDGVRVVRGDLSSAVFLREAITGADAVVSGLGLHLPSLAPWARAEDPAFLDTSTGAIVEAMRGASVRRLVVVSSSGVGDSADQLPAFFKAFVAVTALRTAFAALERMERTLLGSGLDVCIVRPTGLTDEPATGKVIESPKLVGRAMIPRADVAAYMLDRAEAPAVTLRAPVITVTGAA